MYKRPERAIFRLSKMTNEVIVILPEMPVVEAYHLCLCFSESKGFHSAWYPEMMKSTVRLHKEIDRKVYFPVLETLWTLLPSKTWKSIYFKVLDHDLRRKARFEALRRQNWITAGMPELEVSHA